MRSANRTFSKTPLMVDAPPCVGASSSGYTSSDNRNRTLQLLMLSDLH